MDVNIWGIAFIVVGVVILINAFFGFNIPILRILLALLLLYAGVSMLISPPSSRKCISHGIQSQQVVFGKRTFKHDTLAQNYQITFGQGTIDLRKETIESSQTIDVSITFGSATLKLNPEVPTRVTASVSFGKVEFPGKNQISMGSHTYQNYPEGTEPLLDIQAQVSFGSLEIEND